MSQSYRELYNALVDAREREKQAKQDIAKLEERVLKIGKDTIVTPDGTITVTRPKGKRVIDLGIIEDIDPDNISLIIKEAIDLSVVDALVKAGAIDPEVATNHTSYKTAPKPTIKVS